MITYRTMTCPMCKKVVVQVNGIYEPRKGGSRMFWDWEMGNECGCPRYFPPDWKDVPVGCLIVANEKAA